MATLLGARPFFGTIMRIDRANRLVYWRPDGSSEDEEATFDGRRRWAPWPLARARFDVSSRVPRCEHPIGHRERIFRDHFTYLSSPSGDRPWNVVAGTFSAVTGAGLGVARLSGNGTCTVRTDDLGIVSPPSGNRGLLCSFRFRADLEPQTTADQFRVGLVGHGLGVSNDCVATIGSNPTSPGDDRLRRIRSDLFSGGAAGEIEGTQYVADQWYVGDVLMTHANYYAWVDGNGPSSPSEAADGRWGTATSVGVTFFADGVATRHVDLDWIALDQVTVYPGVAG